MTDLRDTLIQRCTTVLTGNQIQSGAYRYTRPAPHTYEQQWLWDSCFHAIVYRWIDPAMAWDELRSLLSEQVQTGADAGMIPHMIYWAGGGEALWKHDRRSIITQPPLIAVAALAIYEKTRDVEALRQFYAPLCDYHHWFNRQRDFGNDHLVSIIHPWESGWDASPRWDLPMRLHSPTPDQSKAARHALVNDLHETNCDLRALQARGTFCVEPADYNAIRAADLEALATIATLIGEDGRLWETKAKAIQHAVQTHLICPNEYGELTVCDLMGSAKTTFSTDSATQYILFFGGCLTEIQAEVLVEYLKSPRFWTHYPITTTPTDHPNFDPTSYWRGNVWVSVNWLIWRGLRRYGYTELAKKLAERTIALVEKHGFHEYFNPITGEGYGPALQSWTTLVLDMALTENLR